MKVSGANVAEALRGPLGWLIVGGVVVAVVYFGGSYVLAAIEAPFKKLGAAVGTAIDNTSAPISTLGGAYTGSDGATPVSPDGTDTLSALALGGLGA